jgi:hypothetical protein
VVKPLIVQCRLLAMTPWLNRAARGRIIISVRRERPTSHRSPTAPAFAQNRNYASIANAQQEPTIHSAIDRDSGSLSMSALSGRL